MAEMPWTFDPPLPMSRKVTQTGSPVFHPLPVVFRIQFRLSARKGSPSGPRQGEKSLDPPPFPNAQCGKLIATDAGISSHNSFQGPWYGLKDIFKSKTLLLAQTPRTLLKRIRFGHILTTGTVSRSPF